MLHRLLEESTLPKIIFMTCSRIRPHWNYLGLSADIVTSPHTSKVLGITAGGSWEFPVDEQTPFDSDQFLRS